MAFFGASWQKLILSPLRLPVPPSRRVGGHPQVSTRSGACPTAPQSMKNAHCRQGRRL